MSTGSSGFAGKKVIVRGPGTGIGRKIALEFARQFLQHAFAQAGHKDLLVTHNLLLSSAERLSHLRYGKRPSRRRVSSTLRHLA